jgi:hypothetical protein
MEKLWHHTFNTKLLVAPEELPVLPLSPFSAELALAPSTMKSQDHRAA